MISLRQSVNDLERLDELQKSTLSCYQLAIRASADYAVDLDAAETANFRQHLFALQRAVEQASRREDLESIQSSFRGELREYRDKANEWLEKTRSDLKAAAEAMQVLAHSVASNGTDHAKVLKADLGKLLSIADSHDLTQIREVIRATAQSISESYECLHRETQLVVAQLHDELRSLHREMDSERKALYTDPASGAWNRDKLSLRIGELLNRGDAFCVVILWVSNLKRLRATGSPSVIEGALKAMVKRLKGLVGSDAMVGRWADDEFAVLLDQVPATALALSSEISHTLSSRYSVQENGVAQHLTLRIATAMADHAPGSDPERFREKLQALAGVIQGT